MARRILESEIEDWIEQYPSRFLPISGDCVVLGRQVSLAHGRVDLLLFDQGPGRLLVVELKARELKPEDVCQVLRYRRDAISIAHQLCSESHKARGVNRNHLSFSLSEAVYWLNHLTEMTRQAYELTAICPVLVGTSCDESIAAALAAADGEAYTWTRSPSGEFRFQSVMEKRTQLLYPNGQESWVTKYTEQLTNFISRKAKRAPEMAAQYLFGRSVEVTE